MTRISLRVVVVAALAAGALAIAAGAAQKPRISSAISARERFDPDSFELVFFGRVQSSRQACRGGRRVELRVLNTSLGHPVALGSDLTDGSGRWEIRRLSDGIGGDYVARAKTKRTANLVCKFARSDPIVFGP